MGNFEVTTQDQGHRQGHPMSHQGQIILEVIQGHFKVKFKNCWEGHVRSFQGHTCKQCSIATKIGQTNL